MIRLIFGQVPAEMIRPPSLLAYNYPISCSLSSLYYSKLLQENRQFPLFSCQKTSDGKSHTFAGIWFSLWLLQITVLLIQPSLFHCFSSFPNNAMVTLLSLLPLLNGPILLEPAKMQVELPLPVVTPCFRPISESKLDTSYFVINQHHHCQLVDIAIK